jgi:hypothetical protein
MKFSNLVSKSLSKHGSLSLSLLLEEKEEKSSSDDVDDPFDADFGDEENSDEDELSSIGGDEGENDPLESLGDDEEKEEEDPNQEIREKLFSIARNDREIDRINNKRSKIAADAVVGALDLSHYARSTNISSFMLFEEKENEEDATSEIEDVLQDYEEKIKDLEDKSFKARSQEPLGAEIDPEAAAEDALHQIVKFDNFYKKSEIIYDKFVKDIARTADVSKAADIIKQFKASLNKKLEKIDPSSQIGIQEKPTKYNAAVGASSAGKS